jgi:hypothetical protein
MSVHVKEQEVAEHTGSVTTGEEVVVTTGIDAHKELTGIELLVSIFGSKWVKVRTQVHKDILMYYACDIQAILDLSNITGSTRGGTLGLRVASRNRVKVRANDSTVPGKVILLNLVGVFQMVLNNESTACKRIRDLVSEKYLPNIQGLQLY